MDYYNENDDGAADWLEWLIARRLIPAGWVDRRSIAAVQPADLIGFRQHHFFAGIGGWPLAIQLARAPADFRIWTGSCPCQPFSSAGRRMGADDPRHLWPHLFRLIDACRPARIVGEQVAGKAGYGWFDGVRADLGGGGYASRALDIPAAAVDAPQIRQRLYWAAVVALAGSAGLGGCGGPREQVGGQEGRAVAPGNDAREHPAGVALGDASRIGRGEGVDEPEVHGGRRTASCSDGSDPAGAAQGRASRGGLALGQLPGWTGRIESGWGHAPRADDGDGVMASAGSRGLRGGGHWEAEGAPGAPSEEAWEQRVWTDNGPHHGPDRRNGSWWAGADWITCHDGKARRVADAIAPLLVTRFPGRVVAWRGVGNAIVPPLACEAIAALIETEGL